MAQTIMIVIVIILIQVLKTMSNTGFSSFVLGVFGGIIPIIFSSLLDRWNKPELKISDKIVERNGDYKFKIQNASNHVLTDVNIHITYRTPQKGYHSYNENNIPILHGEKTSKTNYNNEVTVRFDNAKLRLHKIIENNGGNPQKGLEPEVMYQTIKEFFLNNEDGRVELEVSYCYNRWNKTVREFVRHSYANSNCIVPNSKFPEGSMIPTSLQESPVSYLSS